MANYTLRLAGITARGTRTQAEADIAGVFGPEAARFSLPVGPIGEETVTHWLVASKTRPEVLPYYVDLTRLTHATEATVEQLDPVAEQLIRLDGDVRGGWVIYVDQRNGGYAFTFGVWLATLGLEAKYGSIDGDSPMDAIIIQADSEE